MDENKEKDVVPDVDKPSATNKGTDVSAITKHDVRHIDRSLNALNLFDEKEVLAAENFLTKIMRSEKGGIKSINDGLALLMRAKDLNLPFSACLEHIHVINGKTGTDIHIIKALLSRAGCTWDTIKDYQPLYEYTDGNTAYNDNAFPDYAVRCKSSKEANDRANSDIEKGITDFVYLYPVKWYQDFNGNKYKEYQINTKTFGIAINRQQATEIMKAGKTPVYRIANQPIDYISEYRFERIVNGKTVIKYGKFTYSEAQQAGLLDKENYAKYPRIMISHRAFALGARDIASDILFGCMETTELKAVHNINIEDSDFIEI